VTLRRSGRAALFVVGLLGIVGFLTACAGLATGVLDPLGFVATSVGALGPYAAGLVWGPRRGAPPRSAPAGPLAPVVSIFR
jgi:hypothetical protein